MACFLTLIKLLRRDLDVVRSDDQETNLREGIAISELDKRNLGCGNAAASIDIAVLASEYISGRRGEYSDIRRCGPDVFFIAVRNSPQPLGVTFRPGTRLPASCMASGRALLSSLSDEEVCGLYPDEEIPQMTRANPKYRSELLEILAETRSNGYSREIKGTRPHMFSYGALVASSTGKAVAGVALFLHEDDITPEVEAEAIDAIQSLGSRLSKYSNLLG